jgi:hypothetical protein
LTMTATRPDRSSQVCSTGRKPPSPPRWRSKTEQYRSRGKLIQGCRPSGSHPQASSPAI